MAGYEAWLGLKPDFLGLRLGWLGLRSGWLGHPLLLTGLDSRTKNLPILQDFVPYRGRCLKSKIALTI